VRGRVEGCENVAGEEREAEREVGAGEDGEGLYEYVGDGLIAGEVRVELVAATTVSVEAARCWIQKDASRKLSDRANNKLQWAEGFNLHPSGNRKRCG
jgi:hypothetical protein